MSRRGLTLILLLALGALAVPATSSASIAPRQLVALILKNHVVRRVPGGRRVYYLNAQRPITGERTVVPVLAQRSGPEGSYWLKVRLPGRTLRARNPPATGWIRVAHTQFQTTPWHIVVHLRSRHLLVYNDGRLVRDFSAIVGKPSTPTPTGQFFVEEDVTLSQGQPGGPFALATSDRSKVFQSFDGGPGQIGIHGREDLGGTMGTAESHGCVRLTSKHIRWLAARAGAGTPITIT